MNTSTSPTPNDEILDLTRAFDTLQISHTYSRSSGLLIKKNISDIILLLLQFAHVAIEIKMRLLIY